MLSICSPVPTSSGEAGLERTVHLSFPQSLDVYCGLSLPTPPPRENVSDPCQEWGALKHLTQHSSFVLRCSPDMVPPAAWALAQASPWWR